MPQCNVCNLPKSHYWFLRVDGSYHQPCHLCEYAAQRLVMFNQPIEKIDAVKKIEFQQNFEPNSKCVRCGELGHRCRVCLLIDDFRYKQQAKIMPDNVVPIKRMEDIPLRAVEKTKEEKYTILCQRCHKKRDPKEMIIVGAICEECWTEHERPTMLKEHRCWNKRFKPLQTELRVM